MAFAPDGKTLATGSASLATKAIVAQKLIKGLKKPRCPTNEIMIVNPTIRKLIQEQRDHQLGDAIRIGSPIILIRGQV
jgi:twitching motility protein PilT